MYSQLICLRNVSRTNLSLSYKRSCFHKLLDSCVVLMLSSPCEVGVPGPGAVCVPPLVPQLHSHPLLPLHLTQVSEMTANEKRMVIHLKLLVQKLGTLVVFLTIHALCWIRFYLPSHCGSGSPALPSPKKKMTNCNCKEV